MLATQNQLAGAVTVAGLVLACMCLTLIDSTVEAAIVDCGGAHPSAKLVEVHIAGCNPDKDKQCLFHVNTNASIEAKLEVLRPFSSARIQMFAKLDGGFKLPFHLKPDQACEAPYGFVCPSKVAQQETLRISLPIKPAYPRIAVRVQTKLVDENNRTIICVEVPARIVGPNAGTLESNLAYQSALPYIRQLLYGDPRAYQQLR